MTIDTVSLDTEHVTGSVIVSVLHALNDIFAAGGCPLSISVAFNYEIVPSLSVLLSINDHLIKLCHALDIGIGKLHTSSGFGKSTITVSAFGTRKILNNWTLSSPGVLYLVDHYSSLDQELYEVDIEWAVERYRTRRTIAESFPGPLKDISGDGLAGSLIQLAERHSLDITLAIDRYPASNAIYQLDDCLLDRNYKDYSEKIGKFCGVIDCARNRSTLFEPALFGALIGVCVDPVSCGLGHIDPIGSFLPFGNSVQLL